MREIHIVIALSALSLAASLPQGAGAPSDPRIVNNPVPNPFPVHDPPRDTSPGNSANLPSQGLPPAVASTTVPPRPTTTTTQRPGSLLAPNSQSGAGSRPTGSQDSKKHSSCGLFPSPGECQAAFPRYYYNETTSQCDCYLFGGCDEKPGSYKTLEECHSKCLPDVEEEGPSCKFVFIDNFQPFTPSTTVPTTRGPSRGDRPPPFPVFPAGTRPVSRRPGGPMNNDPAQARPKPPLFPNDDAERSASNPGESHANGRPLRDRQPIPDAPLFPTEVAQQPPIPNPSTSTANDPQRNREPTPNAPLFPDEDTERKTNEKPRNQGIADAPAHSSQAANHPGGFLEEERHIPKPPSYPTEGPQNPAHGKPASNLNPSLLDSQTGWTAPGSGYGISVIIPGITEIRSQSQNPPPENVLPGHVPVFVFSRHNSQRQPNEGDEVESDDYYNIDLY